MNNGIELISSDSFSSISDIVYSRYVIKDFIKSNDFKNFEILSERGNFYLVKIKDYSLSNNSIIYSNTEAIDFLFEDLNRSKELENLTLITHESDMPITKNIYLKKPKSISKWFGINIFYENDNLIPIPIGIPGKFTAFYDKQYAFKKYSIENKINKIYINFRDNTNNKERQGLKSYYKKKDWAVVENHKINSDEYQHNLKKYLYNLCPFGNGIDTYRIWETLASGSIPITKNHPALKSFKLFPIIFLDNLKIENLEKLEIELDKYKNYNFNFLNIEYWHDMIKDKSITEKNNNKVNIFQDDDLFKKKKEIFTKKEIKKSKLKKVKYYLARYTNLKNYYIFFKKKYNN